MHGVLEDFRFAIRQLRKKPGFAVVTILTLALGIGASAIIFSVVYNGVLYPFPYRSAERLTAISIQDLEQRQRLNGMYHLEEVSAFRNGNHSFEDILAYGMFPSMVYVRRNESGCTASEQHRMPWSSGACRHYSGAGSVNKTFSPECRR